MRWVGAFGVGSGGAGEGERARNWFVFTQASLPLAVTCGLIKNRAQWQSDKRHIPKCKK
jgi:hypothetical protein